MNFPHLFKPGRIGSCHLRNRIMMPLYPTKYARDGKPNPKMVEFYRVRAGGGVALIVLDCPCLDYPRAYKAPHQLRIDTDEHVNELMRLLETIKAEGAKVFMQLNYPRERIVQDQMPGAKRQGDQWIVPLATSMSTAEVIDIMEILAQGAVNAMAIGFDGVEIQASYGDLISQLLSPLLNTRKDDFGGNLTNRAKFLVHLIQRVKALTGADFPLMVKLVCDEFVEGGLGITDAVQIAMWAESAGADAVVANGGNKKTKHRIIPPQDSPFAPLSDLAAQIKAALKIPVAAIGKIHRPDVAESIIQQGQADFVALARALISDPEWPRKAASGRSNIIRPCVSCLEDCIGKGAEGIGRCCTVNPFAGHEYLWQVTPADHPGRVLVIGGGPSGIQAALIASQRGHQVELWERSNQLGGQIRWAHMAPFKTEMAEILNYLANCLKNSVVTVRYEQQITDANIASFDPHAVIVATGSRPGLLPIPGLDSSIVVQARDIYANGQPEANKIVIIGGGDIGCETADWLAGSDKQVSVIEIAPAVLARMKKIPRERLLRRLSEKGVHIYENTQVTSLEGNVIHLKKNDGARIDLETDLVVLGINAQSEDDWLQRLRGKIEKVVAVGDAAVPGNLGAALRNATEVALII